MRARQLLDINKKDKIGYGHVWLREEKQNRLWSRMAERGETKSAMVTYGLERRNKIGYGQVWMREEKQNRLWSRMAERGETKSVMVTYG